MQHAQRGVELDDVGVERDVDRGRVDVVGALAQVDVLQRVQVLVLAAGVTQVLQRAVGDDLVGVHVRRGARAALDHVDDELLVQRALPDLLAAAMIASALSASSAPMSRLAMAAACFTAASAPMKIRVDRQSDPGDREVVDRSGGVHAVVGVGGNVEVAEQVVLGAGA